MNVFEKLRSVGISYTQTGDYICPECSKDRKKSKAKCFHIEFRESGVVYRCNHCDFKGGFYHENFKGDIVQKQYKKPSQPKVVDSKSTVYNYLKKRGYI